MAFPTRRSGRKTNCLTNGGWSKFWRTRTSSVSCFGTKKQKRHLPLKCWTWTVTRAVQAATIRHCRTFAIGPTMLKDSCRRRRGSTPPWRRRHAGRTRIRRLLFTRPSRNPCSCSAIWSSGNEGDGKILLTLHVILIFLIQLILNLLRLSFAKAE